MKTHIIISALILSFITISCSKNNKDDLGLDIKHGTLKFEATTTNGGISNMFYEIKDGSIELFQEGLIETAQSEWEVSHPASSYNTYSIYGSPELGEKLSIKVYFDNVLIGSGTSLNGGSGAVLVGGIIP